MVVVVVVAVVVMVVVRCINQGYLRLSLCSLALSHSLSLSPALSRVYLRLMRATPITNTDVLLYKYVTLMTHPLTLMTHPLTLRTC